MIREDSQEQSSTIDSGERVSVIRECTIERCISAKIEADRWMSDANDDDDRTEDERDEPEVKLRSSFLFLRGTAGNDSETLCGGGD